MMKLTLNPYRDNGFMFIDKEAEIFLSIASPVCVIDETTQMTRSIEYAIKGGTIFSEIIDKLPEPGPEVKTKKKQR